jgi:prepilin-type N-terminal cleavage/methylation domain-containing protein
MKTKTPIDTPALPALHNNGSMAFTLIELLVVIAIIAILAGIAMPIYVTAMMTGQMTAASQNARQIGLALRMYANDNDGAYPNTTNSYGDPIATANDAFRSLIPTYVDNEQIFTVARSVDGKKADNKIDPKAEILKKGENHFAYIAGLSSSTNSLWPLVVDSTDGNGLYTNVETSFGGTWKGTKSIVVHVDGSAAMVPLMGPATQRYIPRSDDTTKNALTVSDYMGNGALLLEPAR